MLTHATGHLARLTYNLSPLPSQVSHLGWGEQGGTRHEFKKRILKGKYPRSRPQHRSLS